MEVPTTVYVIWIAVLVVAYLAVPILLIVLTRILRASQKIEKYAKETRHSSQGILAHVGHAGALVETNNLLTAAHGIADEISSEGTQLVGELLKRAGA